MTIIKISWLNLTYGFHLASVLLFAYLVSCYPALHPVQAQPLFQQEGNREQGTGNREQFSSKEGGFTITLPAKPTKKQQSKRGSTGANQVYSFVAESHGVGYYVSYTDLPQEILSQFPEPELYFNFVISNLRSSKNLKLLKEKEIYLGDYLGKEYRLQGSQQIFIHRMYLVKQRFYQITIQTSISRENAVASDIDKFFASFQLLN